MAGSFGQIRSSQNRIIRKINCPRAITKIAVLWTAFSPRDFWTIRILWNALLKDVISQMPILHTPILTT